MNTWSFAKYLWINISLTNTFLTTFNLLFFIRDYHSAPRQCQSPVPPLTSGTRRHIYTQKIVDISPEIQDQLREEGSRHPCNKKSSVLTTELRSAAKSLRENHDIVIRRADKSNTFVILNREDYKKKIQNILKDGSKFQKITKNPCDNIKTKINNLIDRAVRLSNITVWEKCDTFTASTVNSIKII